MDALREPEFWKAIVFWACFVGSPFAVVLVWKSWRAACGW